MSYITQATLADSTRLVVLGLIIFIGVELARVTYREASKGINNPLVVLLLILGLCYVKIALWLFKHI